MFNLSNLFKKNRIWDFPGGIQPPEMKTQSNSTPLRQLPLASRFIIPIKQHIGHDGEICVKPGDRVLRGQALTFGKEQMLPVHAPTSGTIEAIAHHMTAHPSGLSELCIFLAADGEDCWAPRNPLSDYKQRSRADLIMRIHQAGIAGLGGAGFPTALKLRGGQNTTRTLIINAAECEPYITADDRLMQECAPEVIEGSRILAWLLQAEQTLIGIEDNKPQAIKALKRALYGSTDLQLRVIPTKYPSGGAKQLTKILTGMEVPHGSRSSDIGILMQNVGTAYAVKRAIINGEALTERVVTLTGGAIARPGNVWGRLGTPISHLLQHAGFAPQADQMVVMGGPLMGFTLAALDVPVIKITNCLLAPSSEEMGKSQPEQACIRCSACADVCPAALLPQQLYWYSRGGDHDKARAYHLNDCIECGACAYVCPSNIPLVQYYRQEKAELRTLDLEARRNAEAKARFEARKNRLAREKMVRNARHQQAKATVSERDKLEINAALARVNAKSSQPCQPVRSQAGGSPDNEAINAQRQARQAEAYARQSHKQSQIDPVNRQNSDPHKAAVAAAIARAKAKKAAEMLPQNELSTAPVAADTRKAAVAAAIARAKAKKAAQMLSQNELSTAPVAADTRKAAVAAAIARAKAKKAAQMLPQNELSTAPVAADTRKAAVAAAIARVKAKKAAVATTIECVEAKDVQQRNQED